VGDTDQITPFDEVQGVARGAHLTVHLEATADAARRQSQPLRGNERDARTRVRECSGGGRCIRGVVECAVVALVPPVVLCRVQLSAGSVGHRALGVDQSAQTQTRSGGGRTEGKSFLGRIPALDLDTGVGRESTSLGLTPATYRHVRSRSSSLIRLIGRGGEGRSCLPSSDPEAAPATDEVAPASNGIKTKARREQWVTNGRRRRARRTSGGDSERVGAGGCLDS
jgi:hypothetical protein